MKAVFLLVFLSRKNVLQVECTQRVKGIVKLVRKEHSLLTPYQNARRTTQPVAVINSQNETRPAYVKMNLSSSTIYNYSAADLEGTLLGARSQTVRRETVVQVPGCSISRNQKVTLHSLETSSATKVLHLWPRIMCFHFRRILNSIDSTAAYRKADSRNLTLLVLDSVHGSKRATARH